MLWILLNFTSIEWMFLMIDRNFRKYCHCAQFPCQNIATCRHLNFGRFAISITLGKWNSNEMSQLLSILGCILQAYQFHVFKWVLLLLNVHTKNQTCFVRNFWIFFFLCKFIVIFHFQYHANTLLEAKHFFSYALFNSALGNQLLYRRVIEKTFKNRQIKQK